MLYLLTYAPCPRTPLRGPAPPPLLRKALAAVQYALSAAWLRRQASLERLGG